jgi:hypothetical protein
VPRLAVGVYATSVNTALFFAQAVGRFVRARRPGETASVFVPSVPSLLGLAGEMETERDHVIGAPAEPDGWDDALLERANRRGDQPSEEDRAFETLEARAELDQVIFDGASFGLTASPGTPEEEEYLGLPGLLEPDQVALLLHQRQARQLAEQRRRAAAAPPREAMTVPLHEVRQALRRELNGLVAAHHHRTGRPHGSIHAQLRATCGGPPIALASTEEIQRRIEEIRRW